MATKLIVWNDALRRISGHPLADTTTVNAQQKALADSWDAAVEYTLSRVDWTFARRRATLTGTADTSSYQPYTYRFSKPSDYLRKCWIKLTADDEFQIEHAEIAASFYSFDASALIEYMSDHADNYDPANWPPQFVRCMTLYLALLIGPKLGRVGDGELKVLYTELDRAFEEAADQEVVYTISTDIDAGRTATMRRAIEFIGVAYTGSTSWQAKADFLRYQMNKSWVHAVKYVLSQGAWNFATKRANFASALTADDVVPTDGANGIVEGYSLDPDSSTASTTPVSGYDYAYALPDDFLHKIWIKGSVYNEDECPHQIMNEYIFLNYDPAIMEYIAYNSWTYDPANWPPLFLDAVAAFLALGVSVDVVFDGKNAAVMAERVREKLDLNWQRRLSDAKNKDAIQQYVSTLPHGNFARARTGRIGTTALRRLN